MQYWVSSDINFHLWEVIAAHVILIRSAKMTLRWGICSAGKISHDFVVGLKTLPETEHQVVAVAARSLDSASKFAETHSIPRHYGSYEELANDTEVRFS